MARLRQRSVGTAWFIAWCFGGVFVLLSAALQSQTASADEPASGRTPTQGRPNIVVVILDDADTDLLSDSSLRSYFPTLHRLRQEGTRFNNFHVASPLCGPSRMSLLTGLYPQRTGVRTNDFQTSLARGTGGGFEYAINSGGLENNLGTYLQSLDYRTMFVGKFLNNGFVPQVPPGWSDYAASTGVKYFDFRTFQNVTTATPSYVTPAPGAYRTIVERQWAEKMLTPALSSRNRKPFMMVFSSIAPHMGGEIEDPMSEAKYARRWSQAPLPMSDPDFNLADMTLKPASMSTLPLLVSGHFDQLAYFHRNRIRSLRSLDDSLGILLSQIEVSREAERTYVMVLSDNGFCMGHQRVIGKKLPYDRCSRVPLLVWGPGIAAGATSELLISSVDLLPTWIDMAGGTAPAGIDGRSFLDQMLDLELAAQQPHRDRLLVENIEWTSESNQTIRSTFVSLRLPSEVYTLWSDGSREYYDLAVDPFQTTNAIDQLSEWDEGLLRELLELERGEGPLFGHIESPASTAVIGRRTTWKGWAEANAGIKSVELEIRDIANRRWWTGSGWSNSSARVGATLAAPDSILSEWTVATTLLPIGGSNRQLAVRCIVTDRNEQWHATPVRRWSADLTEPVIRLLPKPVTSLTFRRGTQSIPFEVLDESRVARADAMIYDLQRLKYWNGSYWQAAEARIPARRLSNGNWAISSRFPTGPFVMELNATDQRGNSTSRALRVQLLAY